MSRSWSVPLVVINEDQKIYDLTHYMEMYLDKTQNLSIEDVSNPIFSHNFFHYNFSKQTEYKKYIVSAWLRFAIYNPLSKDSQLFLTIDIPNQYNGWTLYEQKGDQFIESTTVKKSLEVTLFPINIPAHSYKIYYLNNTAEGWIFTHFLLKKPYNETLYLIDNYFMMGIQYGVIIALLSYSLFIFFMLRDRGYLIYVGFIFFCLIGNILKDGWLNRIPKFTLSNHFYLHFFRLDVIMIGFFGILFTKNILPIKKYTSLFNRILNSYLFLTIPLFLFAIWTSFRYQLISHVEVLLVSFYIISGMLLSLIATVIIMRRGYKPAKYYLAATIFLTAGYFIYFLMNQQFIEPTPFIFQLPILGLNIAMIFQAIALAMRVNLIQESEIVAQQEVIKQKDINAQLQADALRQQQLLVKGYARFFPQKFLQLLSKKSILELNLGDYTEKNMTVLLADLRDFTTIVEKITPTESFTFINSYLREIGPLVRKYDGFIDKYIGDAILALFEHSADDALYTAIEIVQILNRYKHAGEKLNTSIEMGIGIHCGSLIVGTIGEQERMDETVISDTVNMASRLESLNKVYGTKIIITQQVVDILSEKSKFHIRYLDHVYVKGKTVDAKIYEIFNTDEPNILTKKLANDAIYMKGIACYHKKEFEQALSYFEQYKNELPDDKVCALYIERCKRIINHESSEEWQPIARFVQIIQIK